MKENGINVLSISLDNEYNFGAGKSIFKVDKNNTMGDNIYHVQFTTKFKIFVGNSKTEVPEKEIMIYIRDKIHEFGFTVVIIHPQGFIKLNKFRVFKGISSRRK
jgi:hypothetical protein